MQEISSPRVRLLLANAEAEHREQLASSLSDQGYHVVQARDGNEAIQLLESCSYDLAVLDLRTDGVNGLEILRHMRAFEQAPRSILLTGSHLPDIEHVALALGAEACCPDPISTDTIAGFLPAG